MTRKHQYWTYIVASASGTLYIGVTNSIFHRTREHKQGEIPGFSKQYRCNRLVYYEEFQYVRCAIAREKELKGWSRKKKIALIEGVNPQ